MRRPPRCSRPKHRRPRTNQPKSRRPNRRIRPHRQTSVKASPARTPKATVIPPKELNNISSPRNGALVSGTIPIFGTVDSPDFVSWKLDLLPGGKSDQSLTIGAGKTRIPTDDILTQLDTTRLRCRFFFTVGLTRLCTAGQKFVNLEFRISTPKWATSTRRTDN